MFIFSIPVILKIVHAVLFFPTLVKALALCGRNLEPGVRAHEWSAVRLNGCAVVSGPFSRGVAQLWALLCDQWTDCTRCNGFHCFVHSAVLLSMASSNVWPRQCTQILSFYIQSFRACRQAEVTFWCCLAGYLSCCVVRSLWVFSQLRLVVLGSLRCLEQASKLAWSTLVA